MLCMLETRYGEDTDQIRASDMAPAPAPDIVTSEQLVHEPRETERDVSANVHMGTPSIVMDQPVKRSPQTVTPHKVVAETVRRSKKTHQTTRQVDIVMCIVQHMLSTGDIVICNVQHMLATVDIVMCKVQHMLSTFDIVICNVRHKLSTL